jgi:protoheme IX farnesyltransferase
MLVGFLILLLYTNLLTVRIGIVGLIDYVALYGFFKRRSTLGTLVGSICGATPVVAGYCAATGKFDMAALLLFLSMVCWQMPHFYAIAIYRGKDYASAGLPVLPVVKGFKAALVHILFYTVLFIGANVLLYTAGYAGYVYLAVMLIAGLWWLNWAIKGFWAADSNKWAVKMFSYSLIILMIFSVMISINYWVA